MTAEIVRDEFFICSSNNVHLDGKYVKNDALAQSNPYYARYFNWDKLTRNCVIGSNISNIGILADIIRNFRIFPGLELISLIFDSLIYFFKGMYHLSFLFYATFIKKPLSETVSLSDEIDINLFDEKKAGKLYFQLKDGVIFYITVDMDEACVIDKRELSQEVPQTTQAIIDNQAIKDKILAIASKTDFEYRKYGWHPYQVYADIVCFLLFSLTILTLTGVLFGTYGAAIGWVAGLSGVGINIHFDYAVQAERAKIFKDKARRSFLNSLCNYSQDEAQEIIKFLRSEVNKFVKPKFCLVADSDNLASFKKGKLYFELQNKKVSYKTLGPDGNLIEDTITLQALLECGVMQQQIDHLQKMNRLHINKPNLFNHLRLVRAYKKIDQAILLITSQRNHAYCNFEDLMPKHLNLDNSNNWPSFVEQEERNAIKTNYIKYLKVKHEYECIRDAKRLYIAVLIGLVFLLVCGACTVFAPHALLPILIALKYVGIGMLVGVNLGRIINCWKPELKSKILGLFGIKPLDPDEVLLNLCNTENEHSLLIKGKGDTLRKNSLFSWAPDAAPQRHQFSELEMARTDQNLSGNYV